MATKLASILRTPDWDSISSVARSVAMRGAENALGLGRSLVHSEHNRDQLLIHEAKVLRQPLVNRFVHWSVALSIFALFFSGFGQMPLYKRYMVADLPGLGWTSDFGATLLLHYLVLFWRCLHPADWKPVRHLQDNTDSIGRPKDRQEPERDIAIALD